MQAGLSDLRDATCDSPYCLDGGSCECLVRAADVGLFSHTKIDKLGKKKMDKINYIIPNFKGAVRSTI